MVSKVLIKSSNIIMIFLMIAMMVGCSDVEKITRSTEGSYYFDVYAKGTKDIPREGIIELETLDQGVVVEIENGGKEKQFSVQVFVDYKQTDVRIEDSIYSTYIFESPEKGATKFEFYLPETLDMNYNHSLLVILTEDSDIITSEAQLDQSMQHYSLPLNHILTFKEDATYVETPYDIEETTVVLDSQSSGLLINGDIENRTRLVPEPGLTVQKGETFQMHYQAGGYENVNELAIITTMGLKQAEINDQPYILCGTEDGSLVSGIATYTAPMEEGKYEMMSWVVKNPFELEKNNFSPLADSIRFTLIVE